MRFLICFLGFSTLILFAGSESPSPSPAQNLSISTQKIAQGSILKVRLCPGLDPAPHAKWNALDVAMVKDPSNAQCETAYFAITFDAPLGSQSLEITPSTQNLTFEVLDGHFKSEHLSVDPSKAKLSPENLERVKKETAEVKAIYASPESAPMWQDKFQLPLKGEIRSPYGTKRVFNGETKSHHNGVDMRAAMGTRVHASNDGRVRLIRDGFLAGKFILIEHGGGIFTSYAHLSKVEVKEGDIVKAGQVIARSGASGRVNGPHLHWGVRVHGVEANPMELLKL